MNRTPNSEHDPRSHTKEEISMSSLYTGLTAPYDDDDDTILTMLIYYDTNLC